MTIHADSIPGTLMAAFDGQSILVFGQGNVFIRVLELQPAGKKRMTAEEFLRGHPITERTRFGPEVLS
jgi:methionyl-tRNA formyltransferase